MRWTPTTREVIWAIADARRCVEAQLREDGDLDEMDQHTLRLMEFAAAAAEKADIDRRVSHALEDVGFVPSRLERALREWHARYQHVLPMFGAQAA